MTSELMKLFLIPIRGIVNFRFINLSLRILSKYKRNQFNIVQCNKINVIIFKFRNICYYITLIIICYINDILMHNTNK